MSVKVGINGFGRIGRAAFKIALNSKGIVVSAINDLTDAKTLAHLLLYDSVYGRYEKNVGNSEGVITVDGKRFPILSEKDPKKLPWKKLGVDIVLESTGRFTTRELAGGHLAAGARAVVISAPADSNDVPTYLLGVNQKDLKKEDRIISNASCTTNSIAPIAAILDRAFGVKKASMTTIHSYTADQNLVDGPHKDLRRGRAAAFNIVPTTTGAALTTTKVLPGLVGRFDGLAIRVPTIVGSLSDFTLLLKRPVTVEEVNNIFIKASKSSEYKGIVAVSDEPLVSSDIIKNPNSTIIDLGFTNVIDGDLLKVVAWYDNEWGYANRLVELAILLGKSL